MSFIWNSFYVKSAVCPHTEVCVCVCVCVCGPDKPTL